MPSHVTVNSLGLTYKSTIGISTATIPDVCKTPTPGGPVPIPYPNFAQQSSLDKGTTTVKAKGKMIAIKGSEYSMSFGDEPGTVGGVTSNTFKKETAWITYSFDVKMDGQNACRHTDKKFHNHKNTVDLAGNIDPLTGEKYDLECGECGSYTKLQEKRAREPGYERDHIPSKAALREAAFQRAKPKRLSEAQKTCIAGKVEARGITVAIPKSSHRNFSPTCGSRNTEAQLAKDAKSPKSLAEAVDRDLKAMQKHLDSKGSPDPACAKAYRAAAKEMKEHDNEKMMKQAIKECT